jgi:hypothetical protein
LIVTSSNESSAESNRDQQDRHREEDEAKEKERQDAEKRAQDREAKQKACADEGKVYSDDSGECMPKPKPDSGSNDDSETSSTGHPDENGHGSSCADAQEAFDRFVWECESSGGWERIGSACNTFVRYMNGCFSDPANTTPTDGNNDVCFEEQEPSQSECELKGGIAYYEPGNHPLACQDFSNVIIPASVFDICTDPLVEPLQDQCDVIITIDDGTPDGSGVNPDPRWGQPIDGVPVREPIFDDMPDDPRDTFP